MEKLTVPIKGMHCRSCEMLIEDELKGITSVKKAIVSHKKAQAEIFFDGPRPTDTELKKAVEAAGYSIGTGNRHFFSKKTEDYIDLVTSISIVVILMIVASWTGLLNINYGTATLSSNLTAALLIGLAAGISTCMALVGGLVLGTSARFAEKHPATTPIQRFKPHLFFNFGRIAGFFILGGTMGLIGSRLQLPSTALGAFTMIIGLIMLIMGFRLVKIFPILENLNFTLPKSISRFLKINHLREKSYSHLNTTILGALTFFLPCGFTQAMQLYAISTGSFLQGALVMSIFALGTMPGLLGIGAITSIIKGKLGEKIFKFAGVIVIIFALLNLNNGYNLTGWHFNIFPSLETQNISNSNIKNNSQTINMEQSVNGYTPNRFSLKKGIPVKWIINSTSSYTCASSIVIPAYGIQKNLQPGQNIIEFTPSDSGTIKFTCSMGMFTGYFDITD